MAWAHKRKGKKRKRELRIVRELHRRSGPKAGHGWAARRAARRANVSASKRKRRKV